MNLDMLIRVNGIGPHCVRSPTRLDQAIAKSESRPTDTLFNLLACTVSVDAHLGTPILHELMDH